MIYLYPGIRRGKEDGFNNRRTGRVSERVGGTEGLDPVRRLGEEGGKTDRSKKKSKVKKSKINMLVGQSKLQCDISPPLSAGERLIISPTRIFPNVLVGGDVVGGPGKMRVSMVCSRSVDLISKPGNIQHSGPDSSRGTDGRPAV